MIFKRREREAEGERVEERRHLLFLLVDLICLLLQDQSLFVKSTVLQSLRMYAVLRHLLIGSSGTVQCRPVVSTEIGMLAVTFFALSSGPPRGPFEN